MTTRTSTPLAFLALLTALLLVPAAMAVQTPGEPPSAEDAQGTVEKSISDGERTADEASREPKDTVPADGSDEASRAQDDVQKELTETKKSTQDATASVRSMLTTIPQQLAVGLENVMVWLEGKLGSLFEGIETIDITGTMVGEDREDAPTGEGDHSTPLTGTAEVTDADLETAITVGAITAAAVIAAATIKPLGWLRFIAPAATALFSRFQGSQILDHPRRSELHDLVCRNPGTTVPDLMAITGLSRNAVLHHLRLMEDHDFIVHTCNGRSVHWYENGGRYGREHKAAYAILHDDRSRDVARFILSNPGARQTDVARALHLAPSVISWHLKRLEEVELVRRERDGRSMHCFPLAQLPAMVP